MRPKTPPRWKLEMKQQGLRKDRDTIINFLVMVGGWSNILGRKDRVKLMHYEYFETIMHILSISSNMQVFSYQL